MEELREEWKELYSKTLPLLAKTTDKAQPKWPVALDHCFARIILDNTVGKSAGTNGEDISWDKVIGKPAVRKMTESQLKEAIELGRKIQEGKIDLIEMDKASLTARGKEQKYGKGPPKAEKRKIAQPPQTEESPKKKQKPDDVKQQSTLSFAKSPSNKRSPASATSPAKECPEQKVSVPSNPNADDDYSDLVTRIGSHKDLTAYRKRLYTALLSVPKGRFTTYAAFAKYLDSSARAVGSGIRNNPFAPDVPCHRVLASDRSLGGFGGSWGGVGVGKNAEKKMNLLKMEGVKFDSTGKAKGPVFEAFTDSTDVKMERTDEHKY